VVIMVVRALMIVGEGRTGKGGGEKAGVKDTQHG
jgi:hypothetical protein